MASSPTSNANLDIRKKNYTIAIAERARQYYRDLGYDEKRIKTRLQVE